MFLGFLGFLGFFSIVVAACAQVRRYMHEGDERRSESEGGGGLVGQGAEEAAAGVLVSLSAATASDCAPPSGAAPRPSPCHGSSVTMRRSATDRVICAEGGVSCLRVKPPLPPQEECNLCCALCHPVQKLRHPNCLFRLNKPDLPSLTISGACDWLRLQSSVVAEPPVA